MYVFMSDRISVPSLDARQRASPIAEAMYVFSGVLVVRAAGFSP